MYVFALMAAVIFIALGQGYGVPESFERIMGNIFISPFRVSYYETSGSDGSVRQNVSGLGGFMPPLRVPSEQYDPFAFPPPRDI